MITTWTIPWEVAEYHFDLNERRKMYNDIKVKVKNGNVLSDEPAQITISGPSKTVIYTANIVQEKGADGGYYPVIKFTKNES